MSYLIAAVVLVGALCMLDLLLTVGLIRRLRAQQAPRTSADGLADEGMLPPGAIVGAFETRTVDDRPLHSRDLDTGTVVVFLSPGCPPCHAQLPQVVAALGAAATDGAVAVVAGGRDGDAETEQMLKELRPVARVVHEPVTGPITEAFAARAFPVMCRVRTAGDVLVVEAVGEHVLPAPARAAR
ncbi:TlpA family protein disulfide reductase [Streptomyces olivaceoviridis]|uniref:TlpA family protein disulfide reductase n=1 Tax=Streptomyces olivaceoviridis TaxID=1921 RepID=UPI0036A07DA4